MAYNQFLFFNEDYHSDFKIINLAANKKVIFNRLIIS